MKYIKTFFICMLTMPLMAQEKAIEDSHYIVQLAQMNSLSITQVGDFGFNLDKRKVQGSTMLWDDWKKVDVEIKDGTILRDFEINYDLVEDLLLLYSSEKYYTIALKDIYGFDDVVASKSGAKLGRKYLTKVIEGKRDLYELMAAGHYSLYKHIDLKVLKANYNVALDVGERNTQIKQMPSYYILYEDQLIELPKKRKKAIKRFSSLENISKFLKGNKIDLQNEEDLKGMLEALNSPKYF